jgi:hypothetical protein
VGKAAQGFSLRRTDVYAADEKSAENDAHREKDQSGIRNLAVDEKRLQPPLL